MDQQKKEILEYSEEEIEKLVRTIEEFSAQIKKSKLNEGVVYALLAKALRMNIKDFKFMIAEVSTGRLRRKFFKP